mgnify:CR=1 FL=1|jgi:toxin YoeB
MVKKKKTSSKDPDSPPSAIQAASITAIFDPNFRADLIWWARTQPATFDRILNLIEAVLADPFNGIGKPERLKHLQDNIWSRRITQEHRLVYLIKQNQIYFLQARFHYQ